MKKKDLFDLGEKVVVVTGGSGLIGRALVKALATRGATVIIGEVNEEKGRQLEIECRESNMDVVFKMLDITSEASVAGLIAELDKQYTRLDVWVNNAYPRTKDWGVFFEKITMQSWKENVDLHMNGYFICCQKAAEYMKAKGCGSIINFGSTYGIVGPQFSIYDGTPMTVAAPYSAIKGGIINFTRYLASYYGPHGVRVNSISPGGVFDNQNEVFVRNYVSRTPLRRMASSEDIAGGVVYLASDAAAYVTGHNLVIDGGWTSI
jgi:NAD(P)-dependent dehydrogenase (short-subunit alcohol dehydrogenase family)